MFLFELSNQPIKEAKNDRKTDFKGSKTKIIILSFFFCSTTLQYQMVQSTILCFYTSTLNTKQCSAVDKSQQHGNKFPQENLRECRESNPGPLGAKQERYPLCYAAPNYSLIPSLSALTSRKFLGGLKKICMLW